MNEIQHGFLTTFGLLIPKTESVLLEHIFSQNTMLFIICFDFENHWECEEALCSHLISRITPQTHDSCLNLSSITYICLILNPFHMHDII